MELGDILTKVAGPLVTVLVTAITLYLRRRSSELLPKTLPKTLHKNPRSRLKDDLEILRMLKDTDHPKYDVVRNHVNILVEKVYEQPSEEEGFKLKGPQVRVLFVMGIIALVGFSFWTWSLVRDGFSGWAVGTGFGVLLGIMWIFFSYEEKALPTFEPYYCTKCNKYHKRRSAIGLQHVRYKGTKVPRSNPLLQSGPKD